MKKRLLSLALALILCLGLAVPAAAAQISDTAGFSLTQAERRIYNAAETMIRDVAAGKRTDTRITIRFPDRELGWTARELGLPSMNNYNAQQLAGQRLFASLSTIRLCFEFNIPQEMFFSYGSWRCDWAIQQTDQELWVVELTCWLIVSPDYQGGSDTTVNPAKIARANAAKANARAIVQANEGKSNYEKLAAYREAIADLTEYDYVAYEQIEADTYIYGDPSQLISVFDGDPNTNVVCEGYAKAFKYLCDLSSFDGDVNCFVTAGDVNGEGHVWNVVRMEDGKYYLTDTTLFDTNRGVANIPLLACSNENPANYNYQQVLYTYRENQYGLFTNGFLPISDTPYEPGHAVTTPTPTPEQPLPPELAPAMSFTDVKAGDYFADAVQWAVERNITKGTSAATFSPAQTCTQAQILTFLWRAKGSPAPKTAPASSEYYAKAAQWAREQNIIDNFNPNAPCTRAMTVDYLWRAAGRPQSGGKTAFTDVAAGTNLEKAVAWAVQTGVTTGTGKTTFSPSQTCTRGQIVTFLYRSLK